MSKENVAIIRRAVEAFNEGDLDALLREFDAEVEIDWSRSRGMQAGIYRGSEVAREFWADFLGAFEGVTLTPEEFIESGVHVVVPNRVQAWGRDGIEVVAQSAGLATFRDGRIIRWRLYQDPDQALKAVGLVG